MSSLCGWCGTGMEEVVAPYFAPTPPKVNDFRKETREAIIPSLGGNIQSSEKESNLDELIHNVNDDDLSVEDIIKRKQESTENLESLVDNVRSLLMKTTRLTSSCQMNRWDSESMFIYQRIEVNHVKVESSPEGAGFSRIALKTTPARKTKDFGHPAKIPSVLSDIITLKDGAFGLPDYTRFFERSLLLNDEVLRPFLRTFRAHLQNVHSFFNEIQDWIEEPDEDRIFMEQTFGVDFDFSVCVQAGKQKADDATEASTDHSSFNPALESHELVTSDDSSDDGQTELHKNGINVSAYSNVRRAVVNEEMLLKEYSSEGSYSLSFDIEYGQKHKLVKFIEFLEN